ncbi:TaqI-like C-terminal specificity domain-containing protein [Pedobacter xixiisoli]|uniref:N-6 DNA Methylase n=1 Tax=Pedobacter xixiisoli TaxID=1476464 RepID=A0A286A6Y8_9SPHI|nr:TaqI-like C-terminal specificity domain-containing protein [Pedobacter xixiisoli]SOD17645.1 N-6 DNA Methylase [Pedobacter xixiisoli]
MNYKDFFSVLGFDFQVDLQAKVIDIEKEAKLSQKLENSVFFYKSPNNTNTSFYLLTTPLESEELARFRKYVWNKNDADIIFHYQPGKNKLVMMYAKYSPKVTNEESKLDIFTTDLKDLDKIEKIKHWKFDSGVFWLNYRNFINKSKYKGVDKELVAALKALREQLNHVLAQSIKSDTNRNELVQALIDRTLYIKYLEDNHIINSYFYEYYFNDTELNYERLLLNSSNADINKLYGIIHEIFNNALFDRPTIEEGYLTGEVRSLIATSFSANLDTGQLRLYDFGFDILPVEFISYIYEVFLSEKQKENGIYYTPKKLAQLLVDDVIKEDRIGSVLDPSSGSGMFLIVGYQRLLEIAKKQGLEPQDSIEKIRYRTKLLSENIFGIEKELTAQRFTLFSLSLQIFVGIDPDDIKDFIAKELRDNKKIDLFSEYSFFSNIRHANTLDIADRPFDNQYFSYLLGNPPFFEIPNTEEFNTEISFLDYYPVANRSKQVQSARHIVGRSQISQCFFLKMKVWSNENTRFGFVSNSSSFYNDYSEAFQEFFYASYGIEKVYELSRVKKILFEKATESVVALIFSNRVDNNTIGYYPVEMGVFSERPFELLVIQDDKVIEIDQNDLLNGQVRLRDFLVGNSYDSLLVKKLLDLDPLDNYILREDNLFLHRGIDMAGFEEIEREFNVSKDTWKSLSKNQKNEYYKMFRKRYSSPEQSDKFPVPFIKPSNIEKHTITSYNSYLGEDISMFHRPRKKELYEGKRIVWSRIGKSLKAVYLQHLLYFDFDLYVLKLNDDLRYELITTILNSNLIDYFINIHLKKRIDSSYPKIGIDDIRKIPLPFEIGDNMLAKISTFSREISAGKYKYEDVKDELNELIYDLYELSYWEKQRIRDYFLPNKKIGRRLDELKDYKAILKEIIGFYFASPITVDETSTDFDMIVIKLSFSTRSDDKPPAQKTKNYLLNEIFEQNSDANFLASQEKIFGTDCVYIIKRDLNGNWTQTKAFEDGQDILKHLISFDDGERVH